MRKQCTKKSLIISVIITFFLLIMGCNNKKMTIEQKSVITPRVYLYGESHGEKVLYDAELRAWQNFYNNQNMRHLFIETGYSTAQMLNQWMKAEEDTILLEIYENWTGTDSHNEVYLEFLKNIKKTCKETIFHGTDVGHQYETNDSMLLQQLEIKGLVNSKEYQIVLENIEQAKHYKKYHDSSIRENYMVANFIRELDSLSQNEKIMGIYGSGHINYVIDQSCKVPSMISQIRDHYNDDNQELIQGYNLIKDFVNPPLGTEYFVIKEKSLKATYFGDYDLTGWDDYLYWKIWRIENPDQNLKNLKIKRTYIYNYNFPTLVNTGDIFRIEYTRIDGSKKIEYYRYDEKKYDGQPSSNLILRE